MPNTRSPHRFRPYRLALFFFLAAAPCRAAVVYVNKNAPGPTYDGTSWSTAFTTAQQGIDAATSGDEVWVAAGTYQEHISLKNGVRLFGGFIGTEAGRGQRSPQANTTILDGQHKATVVTIAADATSDTVLDGFTVENGYGPIVGSMGMAGGVFIQGGTPIVSDNVITGCVAAEARTTISVGGGIYVADGTPLIAGNTITNNFATFGGGIFALGGLIRDNYIAYNVASHSYVGDGQGGGLDTYGAAVVHNLIRGNTAPDGGGGGSGANGEGVLMDNIFQDNFGLYGVALRYTGISTVLRNTITDSSTQYQSNEVEFYTGTFADNLLITGSGDAIVLGLASETWTSIQPLIANNTFIKTGVQSQAAIFSMYLNGEQPVVANNITFGWAWAGRTYPRSGTPPVFTVDHNDAYGNTDNTLSFPGTATGNISQDPVFVNPSAMDYRLQAGSPCIDAGNDAYVASSDRDLAGAPRIYGAHVDIGAYEYGSPAYTLLDAAEVLRVAAGISIAAPADIARLDVVQDSPGTSRLTVLDATRIAQWLLN